MGRLVAITDESVINKIHHIRGKKVMLDRDLAEMYGVETSQLKRQVKRNVDRFPEDFMFEMSDRELSSPQSLPPRGLWRKQPRGEKKGRGRQV
jgi:hypothetical protein